MDKQDALSELSALIAEPYVPVASELLSPRDEHGQVEGAGW